MRIAAFVDHGQRTYAELRGSQAHLFNRAPWDGGTLSGGVRPFVHADFACPVAPSKIVCVGRNYAAHAKELGNDVPVEPLLFLKPPSSLVGPGVPIELPEQSTRIEHEAELGVVIAKRLRRATEGEIAGAIFGYTCVGDITARDLQRKDGQWARAKGFDTFCPTGPWIETALDPRALTVAARVNGETRQSASTADMVFAVTTLLAYISQAMTLEPGDLVITGTPEGVGPLVAGDQLEIDIQGIGVLQNPVVARRER
jgi:2-keto-4-pentenoate hydratase/2-oxohepta-3-ene-1,7-dioic acid hydratase in catechol pathway